MNEIELSVIVPVYNYENYLKTCIDSLIAQAFQEMEIVLVDDGSTDGSGRICDEYARCCQSIRVVHKENGGLISARIEGIENASGEWIGFVDSDDYVDANMYGSLLQAVREDKTDIGIGGYVYEGDMVGNVFHPAKATVLNSEQTLNEMFKGELFNWSLCDKVYKKEWLKKCLAEINLQNSYGEDTYINWRYISTAGGASYVPLYGYHYNIHHNSMVHKSFTVQKFQYFKIYCEILEDLIAKKKDALASSVTKVMTEMCLPIAYDALMERDKYANEIRDQIRRMDEYLFVTKTENAIEKSGHKGKYLVLHKDIKTIDEEIKRQESLIRDFISDGPFYVYGAGKIAEEVLSNMAKIGIAPEKIIVTGKPQRQKLNGIPIISLCEVIHEDMDKVFVLAMNASHTNEVLKKLENLKMIKYLDVGKYSANY